ncbi:MAG: GNAT family N-acetyltransferase [Cyclobacteriaceae bacterium]|nr:GNAT family N-acetyltransferase [Cyclobacteriaceae bacterium]
MIFHLKHQNPCVAAKIKELQQESYRVEARLIDYDKIPYMAEGVPEIQSTNEIFIGYLRENELAGVISYEKAGENLTICRLVVKPEFFGSGIAKSMLKALEEMEPEIRSIYVGTAEKNIPAISLYIKSGYTVFRKLQTPDGLNLVRLRKIINR